MEWKPIEEANGDGPYLVCEPTWLHADVMMRDSEGVWYSPVDGSETEPQPTFFMSLPDIPA